MADDDSTRPAPRIKAPVEKHPLYGTWADMRKRCLSPKNPNWPDYGGRGIGICERWSSFHAFVADMGERPEGHTLDRRDNDGPYSPDNCRWATQGEQMRNTRRTVRVRMNGTDVRLADLAERHGICAKLLAIRVKRGWPIEDAISRPPQQRKPNLRKLLERATRSART